MHTYVLAPPTPAQITQYFPEVTSIVQDQVVAPGSAIEIVAPGFVPNELVNAVFAGQTKPSASSHSNNAGIARFSVQIPTNITGTHVVLAVYSPTTGFGVRQKVALSPSVPQTGADSSRSVRIAVDLLLAGVLLGVVARRNRQHRRA